MRKVLLEELPWQEGLEGLPMKKELEALDRLPGEYTVTKTSKEVIKDGGGGPSQWEARYAERFAGELGFKKGGKVSILKEMRGDPVVLWDIVASTESGDFSFPIFAQPLQQKTGLGRDGRVGLNTNLMSGVQVGKEACYTGKVESIVEIVTRDGKMVMRISFCSMVDGKGKLEVTHRVWKKFETGAEIELITTAVAQKD